ncbi:lipid A deacylase LpxR family protein [Roseomonas sp. PWR1]|uniref:Lipid A deacylase LpxR family protein n=1 Tax=Roseomonas nitratireducens TaxID=2820810 RepID=A0ABS4AZ27_9PROT|nr:lipid A deacylase LpxR family protein [Neoroseomonas nitratireducens]
MTLRICAAALVFAAAAAPARAEDRVPGDHLGTWSFTYENDLLAGTDRYYTSGFQFAWRSSSYDPPAWLAAVTSSALFPEGGTPRWGLAFGQNIFTPADTARRDPDPRDRPYAGWLYGAINLASYTPTTYGSIELQLGVVGPSALGEQTQNNVHDLLNIDRAYGWDRQLKDEPGVNLILTRQWRYNTDPVWDDIAIGIVPTLTASLGNVQTYGAAGLMVRFGNELQADFGPPRMRPSVAGSAFYQPDGRWGWYVFGGLEGRVVGRDIFLDGNTWRDSRSVDREVFVGDASAGVAIIMPFARLTVTYTARSREFETQRNTAQYGSISLSFRY